MPPSRSRSRSTARLDLMSGMIRPRPSSMPPADVANHYHPITPDSVKRTSRCPRSDAGSGRTPLLDSAVERVAQTFDRAVDRCVDVRSCHAYADRPRRLQSDRHGAGHPIARAVITWTKQNPSGAERESVARKCREDAILSIRARLRTDGVVVADDVNAFHPLTHSQAPGQGQ